MSWTVCLILSLAVLALAAVICIIIMKNKRLMTGVLTPFNVIFAGVLLATAFLFIPFQSLIQGKGPDAVVKAVLIALQNAMQTFTVDSDFSELRSSIMAKAGDIAGFYSFYSAVLFVVAPMLTFGFVMSFFKNAWANFAFLFSYFRDTYVFTELNERSLTLAASIKDNHDKCSIVFTDVFEENEEGSYELVQRAKLLGAICFKKDILLVNFNRRSPSSAVHFFAIGENETENIDQSLKLIKTYNERENTHLYVFSTGVESELLLTSVNKGKMKVRRINEVRSLVNRILYEKGKTFFENALPGKNSNKTVAAVIVGMGHHGTEMLKALTWFGQMDGYNIEIDAFDKDELAKEKFSALCPELMSDVYNGTHIEGESEYLIRIHPNMHTETKAFADAIMALDKTTYVLVSLGSDELNIKTAVNLRMLFERNGAKPVIHAIVNNSNQKNALEGIKNYRGQPYDITFIGDLESSFTEDVIMESDLEADALSRHLKWGNEEEFWEYEYNYRSSIASAIHIKARIALGIRGAHKKEEDLTEEERDLIENLEHRRWNTYMRSEGYVYSGNPDKSSRNDLGKMHHNLVDFETLSDEDKRKDSRVGTV